jgi:cytochrome c
MLRFALRQALVTVMLMAPASAASPDIQRGKAYAQRHCARCHAIDLTSRSPLKTAPPFRLLHNSYPVETLAESLAEGISTGHPAMPTAELEPDQIHALLVFLKSLE